MAGHWKRLARAVAVLATVGAGVVLQPTAGGAVPPANDLIENATAITALPFSATQSTQDASQSPSDPPATCVGGTYGTVWFRYNAPANQLLRASSSGATLVVYQGSPGSLTQVACAPGQQPLALTGGQTYY